MEVECSHPHLSLHKLWSSYTLLELHVVDWGWGSAPVSQSKTKHINRIVFQDQANWQNVRSSFRGAKISQIGKKILFLAIVKNVGKWWKIKTNYGLYSCLKNTC